MKKYLSILPEALFAKLNGFESRLRVMETAVVVLGSICGLVLSYLLLFISDRFWSTPIPLRVILVFGSMMGMGILAYKWFYHWFLCRRDVKTLSRLVQKHHRGLGDHLLGVVELSEDEQTLTKDISPQLRRCCY